MCTFHFAALVVGLVDCGLCYRRVVNDEESLQHAPFRGYTHLYRRDFAARDPINEDDMRILRHMIPPFSVVTQHTQCDERDYD
jgi:hypothetical protein